MLLPLLISMFILNSSRCFAAFPAHASNSAVVKIETAQDSATEKRNVITKHSNGFGIASFICSIVAFPVYVLGALDTLWVGGMSEYYILAALIAAAAVALGVIGINKRHKGLAIAGLALSLATLIPFVLLLF